MSGTEGLDIAQPAMDDQPPGDCPDEKTETFGAAIDAILGGAGGAAPVGDETPWDGAGDEDEENGDSAGREYDGDGGDDAHDEGEDGGDAPPVPAATGTRASAASTASAAPTPLLSRGRTFVVTLRIALTGDDASHPGMAPYGHMVAGPPTMGVVTADTTPAIVRRMALDDAAALGAALLALPGDYAKRDAARKAAAAARAEADKQERKEQQATQRKEAAAAKKKADLLATARKAGSALATAPVAMAAASAPVPPPSEPTPTPSDGVTPAPTSAASDDAIPTPRMPQPAASPALPPRPATGKTTGKTKAAASSALQPSLFS